MLDLVQMWVIFLLGSLMFSPFYIGILAVYFAPAIAAFTRRHRSRTPISIINLFLGWTFVGWVVALAWAFGRDREPVQPKPYAPRSEKFIRGVQIYLCLVAFVATASMVWEYIDHPVKLKQEYEEMRSMFFG